MDKPDSDLRDGIQKETRPWWRGRVLICGLVVFVLFTGSSRVLHGSDSDAWLPVAGCMSGSLLVAPLIVYLVERLAGVDMGMQNRAENNHD